MERLARPSFQASACSLNGVPASGDVVVHRRGDPRRRRERVETRRTPLRAGEQLCPLPPPQAEWGTATKTQPTAIRRIDCPASDDRASETSSRTTAAHRLAATAAPPPGRSSLKAAGKSLPEPVSHDGHRCRPVTLQVVRSSLNEGQCLVGGRDAVEDLLGVRYVDLSVASRVCDQGWHVYLRHRVSHARFAGQG